MRPSTSNDELEGRHENAQPENDTEPFDTSLETDEDDLDESHVEDADDSS